LLRLCDHLSGRRVTASLGAAYPELTSSPCEEVRMKTSSLPSSADDFVPAWPCSRRGLPGHPHYCRCRWSFTPPFHSCYPHPVLSPIRRGAQMWESDLFLWPFSGRLTPHGGFPAPGAIRRRALWSADFPRSREHRTAIAQPTWGGIIIHAREAGVNIGGWFQIKVKHCLAHLIKPLELPKTVFYWRKQ